MIVISIVVATYNADKYITRCLESIIAQKTEEIELIVIDGYSSDSTIDIIKNFSSKIDYTLIEKDNGVYDAWNKALRVAKGEWIQFIGADDILLPTTVVDYLSFLRKNNLDEIDCVSAKSEYVNSKGQLLQYRGKPYSWNIFRRYMCMSHGSTLHRHNLFNQVGTYNLDYKICGDYELLMRKKENLKTLFFDQPVIRMQAGGLSFTIAGQLETYKIRKNYYSVSTIDNIYLLIRGIIGFYTKKLIWKI